MEWELTYLGKSIQREKKVTLPPPPLSAKTSDIVHNNIVSLIHTCPEILNLGNELHQSKNQGVSLFWPGTKAFLSSESSEMNLQMAQVEELLNALGTLLSSTLDVRPAQEFTCPTERTEKRIVIKMLCTRGDNRRSNC